VAAAVVLAAAAAFLALPELRLPAPGLDPSWALGISLADLDARRFGQEIVFTFGPFGFLDLVGVLALPQLAGGMAAGAAVAAALVASLWLVARRWAGDLGAALLVGLVLVPAIALQPGFSDRVLMLSVVVGIALRTGALPARSHRLVALVLAALGALAVLTKFSNGVLTIGTVALVALVAVPQTARNRMLTSALAAGTVVVGVPLLWLLAGQEPADLASWLAGSLEITRGYAEAMALEAAPVADYLLLAELVVVALLIALTRGARDPVLLVFVGWTAFLALRLGFTRHDGSHAAQAFLLLGVLIVALTVRRHALAGALSAVLAAALVFSGWGASYRLTVDPVNFAARAATDLRALLSASDRDALLAEARESLRAGYDIPSSVIGALGQRPVHVDPNEIAAAWAYDLTWSPIPPLQSYSAYTPALDQASADAILSANGPTGVLRSRSTAIDGRNPAWESPRYQLALACGYRVAARSDDWLALIRSEQRCGPAERIASIDFVAGQEIEIPRAPNGSLVVASVELESNASDILASALFKPATAVFVEADGNVYRVPRAHLDGPLLVGGTSATGWGAAFGGDADLDHLAFPGSGRVTFSTIPIDAAE
jgi:hypothetical protein